MKLTNFIHPKVEITDLNKENLMRREFTKYYGLKRYLTVVAQNNNHNINFDNYEGLETIYKYLLLHKDKISYGFSFTEWIKLSADNNTISFGI